MNKKYKWLTKDSRTFLSRGYIDPGDTVENRIRVIAETAENILKIDGFADKFENYMALGYYTLATPVFINFGTDKGYPVSCFGSYVEDDTIGILRSVAEVGVMSKMGGGTSAYFGDVRCRGSLIKEGKAGKTDGPIRFMELFDKTASVISQGSNRRGSFAGYLPVEHDDIDEFLNIKSEGNAIQDMSFGVTATRQWMKEMKEGDKAKRKVWSKIIKSRFEKGYPYIMFTDNSNDAAPQVYKDKGMKIKASNLCSEIQLCSDENNSFVCVLSCLNLIHWDEIKDTDAIETLIYFLDAVNEEFIQKSNGVPFMEKANHFARTQRALGAGVMGWHHYLQSKMIPFESMEAKFLNLEIFETFRKRADKATEEMAKIYGEPELLKGYNRRNVTTMSLPPTTSSSTWMGKGSQSIEPEPAVYFVQRSAKGTFETKNPYFEELLEMYGKNDKETWNSILLKGGSVQHLDFLTDLEKDVFKTFGQVSQKEIVIQAIQRGPFIDQSTSLNLMIPHNAKPKDVSELLIFGEEHGIKTFYYQRSSSPSQEAVRNILSCSSCEG